MGDKIKNNNAFGDRLLETFKKGDLVSWKTNLDEKREYGIITNIYVDNIHANERDFMFASIRKPNGAKCAYMLSILTKES